MTSAQTLLPTIENQRLVLAPVSSQSAEMLFPIMSNEELMRHVLPPSESVEQLKGTLGSISSQDAKWVGWWYIQEKESQGIAGLMMYYGRHFYNNYCFLAYLVDAPYRGKGIAKGAASMALDYLFHESDVNRVEAEVEPENIASCALLKALGFTLEAPRLRQRLNLRGSFQDVSLFGILKSDWRSKDTRDA